MLKKGLILIAFTFMLGGCFGGGNKEEEKKQEFKRALFLPLPDIVVNLVQSGNKKSFLKIALVLEVHDINSAKKIENTIPRIVDKLQLFLRTLRVSDLEGTVGMPRLKAHLKAEVNAELKPYSVADVLFKEVIVQ